MPESKTQMIERLRAKIREMKENRKSLISQIRYLEQEKKDRKKERIEKRVRKEWEKRNIHTESRKWSAEIRENGKKMKREKEARKLRENNNGWKEEVNNHYKEQKKFEPQKAFISRSAHHGKAIDYTIKNLIFTLPEKFLKKSREEVFRVLRQHIPSKTTLKLQCLFENINSEDNREDENHIITITILTESNLEELYEEATKDILEKIFNFTTEKSGWRLKKIIALHLHVSNYNPMEIGSSYCDLPKHYKDKKCIINILNMKDKMCGKWAITIALNMPEKNKGRITKEVIENSKKYNWEGINFPMTVKDIEIFERNNKNIALIVHTNTEKQVAPLWISKRIDNVEKENIAILFVYKEHFCVVTNESALLGCGDSNLILPCRRCGYKAIRCGKSTAEEKLEKH